MRIAKVKAWESNQKYVKIPGQSLNGAGHIYLDLKSKKNYLSFA